MDIYIPFGWFYLFNLIILTAFLLFYGIKKSYPLAAWTTLIAWVLFFFLAGLKLMNFPLRDWGGLLFDGHDVPVYQKFVPGGVLFFAIGLVMIRVILGFRKPVLDGLILALPLAIAVQRTGCFINGCCYGKPTSLPWAVQYHPGTSAYQHYLDAGLVQPGDALSCGLHPAQLYTLIGALIIFVIMWRFRNSWKSGGGRVLFGMILLVSLRFFMEFFRAADGWKWYSGSFAGLNYLQWIILALMIAMSVLFVFRERRPQSVRIEKPYSVNYYRSSAALFILIFLVWNTSRLFEFHELFFIGIMLATALIANMVGIYSRIIAPAFRYGTIALLLLAFVTMSQDVIRTEADTVRKDPGKTWFTLGLGGSTGSYEERVRNCSGEIVDRRMRQETSGNLNLAFNYVPHPKHHMEYGLDLWVNNDKYKTEDLDNTFYKGITPYIRYDLHGDRYNWLGLMIGANIVSDKTGEAEALVYVIPDLYLRVGPKELFFADIGVGNQVLMTGKPDIFQVGFGAGLGKSNPGMNTLRFGLSIGPYDLWDPEDNMRLYLAGDFRIGSSLSVKPGIYFINKFFGTFGIRYDIGRGKQWNQGRLDHPH